MFIIELVRIYFIFNFERGPKCAQKLGELFAFLPFWKEFDATFSFPHRSVLQIEETSPANCKNRFTPGVCSNAKVDKIPPQPLFDEQPPVN